jgi:tripartite ATP-independent transporter DctP family solute receptor
MKRLLAAAVLVLLLGAHALAQDKPITLRLGHILNETSLYQVSAALFADALARNSGGRLKVDIFPNGQIGFERDLIEGMRVGTVDAGVITNAPISGFEPRMQVLDLPFIFKSREGAFKVMDGEVGRKLFGNLEERGLKGLAYFDAGWRVVVSTKRPLAKPEDYPGTRFRVMENPLYVATFRALGVNATPLNWGEVYTGLRQGTIDSLDLPIYVVYTAKIYEVAKFLAETEHMYTPVVLMMSQAKFQSLPADLQRVVVASAQEVTAKQRQTAAEMNRDFLVKLREKGMTVVPVPDKRPFQDRMQAVYREFESKLGPELIAAVRAAQ